MLYKKKKRPTYTPSQCQNEKQTSSLGFLDEITKSEFFIFVFYLVLLYPPRRRGPENGKWGVGILFFRVPSAAQISIARTQFQP